MDKVTQTSSRKQDHIRINLEENVRSGVTTGLEQYRFIHQALPEIKIDQVDLSLSVFARKLQAPILISSMTGGSKHAHKINQTLAAAAQMAGIAMGLGSQRAGIENPELVSTFQVRNVAPDILLFANLGAIQLNYGYGIDQCQRAVDMIEANALILHFNALQEAVQPEGETDFSGLVGKVSKICKALPVPVIAKEVGWGFSEQAARILVEAGVSAIDVAGAGGTSWSQVESYRANDEYQAQLAQAFVDWGIPTAEAILNVSRAAPGILIFASGGLRNGVDIAKSIALGATLGGLAGPFLKAASQSLEITQKMINLIKKQIQVCMFATGSHNLVELKQNKLEKIG